MKVGSIQAFAQHYAAHAEPGFVVPSEFKDKMKTVLPCPQCNISIQGVWKYFQHTFTHDKVRTELQCWGQDSIQPFI